MSFSSSSAATKLKRGDGLELFVGLGHRPAPRDAVPEFARDRAVNNRLVEHSALWLRSCLAGRSQRRSVSEAAEIWA